jgi:DNA-binding NtrC family response regulator
MSPKSPLEEKIILVVDDEPDVLETVGEILDMCLLYKAKSYEEGMEYLRGYTIDIAILDIMGVNGFELLKRSVDKGIPTLMLTAHALTPEALKKSMKLGAVTFLPKEKISDLQEFLEEVVLRGGKPIWIKFFDQLGA